MSKEAERQFSKMLDTKFTERKQEFADTLMSSIKSTIDGYLGGRKSTMRESINYELTDDGIELTTDDKRVIFFEQGTRPHTILPKKFGGVLAWRSDKVFTRKDGSKVNYGDWVFSKKVEHPGTEPRPIMNPALFITKKKFTR